ncbi:MAG: carboxymuconolactone decarboxylase family protein [Opitutae bacterium]|nr:carboxymuconolactone decarboxylase family protein [Opitutae bacterium]MCD8299087.1 carboxymuconolactone decarboxylase family protein [Opitutae bacterium]
MNLKKMAATIGLCVAILAGVISAGTATTNDKMNALNEKERQIALVSAAVATGDAKSLRAALNAALDAGLTVNEGKEILTQLYAYCGFPRSLNALGNFMSVLDERKARGIADPQGKLPSPLPSEPSIKFGTENQTKLCGAPVKGALFEFAPAIDEYLKSHLFGDIFARDNLDWKTRELATIAALAARPETAPQLKGHIEIGKYNGITDAQVAEILALVCKNDFGVPHISDFPVGAPNTGYAQYFTGKSFLAPMTTNASLHVPVANVTFEPSCRNNWHSHTGGQILIAVGGVGYYQERGKPARRLLPGDIVEIPQNVEHWHGAAPDSWFSHLAIECNPTTNKNTWLDPVSDADYAAATKGK